MNLTTYERRYLEAKVAFKATKRFTKERRGAKRKLRDAGRALGSPAAGAALARLPVNRPNEGEVTE